MNHIFIPRIQNTFYNEDEGILVVCWETGEETKVKVMDGDKFDVYLGVQAAIAKYACGNTSVSTRNILHTAVRKAKSTAKRTKNTKKPVKKETKTEKAE
jgi:hypothetical protein